MTTMHPVHKMCLPTLAMVLALVLLPKVPLASGHRLSLKSISLKVGDCSNCGMGVLGQLSIKVCGNGSKLCCLVHHIDHLLQNDFVAGRVNVYEGSSLQECEHFDLGDETLINQIKDIITIYHSGTDSIGLEAVTLGFSDAQVLECQTSGAKLDNNEFYNVNNDNCVLY